MMANPTISYQVHNTLFFVAHFHNVLIPSVLFGLLAEYHYWFPKAFVFRLNERRAYISASLWIVGFCVTFLQLYVLGLMGMPRLWTPAVIAVFAFGQIVVHFRNLLHIGLSRQKRDNLQLIPFTLLILGLMCAGTIWIVANLGLRM